MVTKDIARNNKSDKHNNPKVVSYGLAVFKGKMMAWAVMPRYLMDLETYFSLMTNVISLKSICEIGVGLLSLLEGVHRAGYVFNNLKPESIMLCKGPNEKSNTFIFNDQGFGALTHHLIDFGFVTKFVDENG